MCDADVVRVFMSRLCVFNVICTICIKDSLKRCLRNGKKVLLDVTVVVIGYEWSRLKVEYYFMVLTMYRGFWL